MRRCVRVLSRDEVATVRADDAVYDRGRMCACSAVPLRRLGALLGDAAQRAHVSSFTKTS